LSACLAVLIAGESLLREDIVACCRSVLQVSQSVEVASSGLEV
jgi:hypothetical protein